MGVRGHSKTTQTERDTTEEKLLLFRMIPLEKFEGSVLGLIVGFLVGYLIRTFGKLVLITSLSVYAVMAYLSWKGFIVVKWEQLKSCLMDRFINEVINGNNDWIMRIEQEIKQFYNLHSYELIGFIMGLIMGLGDYRIQRKSFKETHTKKKTKQNSQKMVRLTQIVRRWLSTDRATEMTRGFVTVLFVCLLVLPERVFIFLLMALFNLLFYPLLLLVSVVGCAIVSRLWTKHRTLRKQRTKPFHILLGDSCIDEDGTVERISDYNSRMDSDLLKLDDEIECEICLLKIRHNDSDDPCIVLEDCNHHVCGSCMFQYLTPMFGDLNKYPLSCFAHRCNHELHDSLVEWLLNWQQNVESTEEQKIEHHSQLSRITQMRRNWVKFNKLSKIPVGSRLMCPNPSCDAVMSLDSDYYRIVASEETPSRVMSEAKLEFLAQHKGPGSLASQSVCGQCGIKFGSGMGWWSSLMGKWRHPCPLCCKLFCDDCLSEYRTDVPELGYFSRSPFDNHDQNGDSLSKDDGSIRMCRNCFTLLYRRTCEECRSPLCTRCQSTWHGGMCRMDAASSENDASSSNLSSLRLQWWKERRRSQMSSVLSEEMMFEQGWVKCPGCRTYVCKDGGCNHMSHKGCPQSCSQLTSVVGGYYDRSTTHFCYCCGELLFRYHEECDGRVHFPNGLFSDCRKADSVRRERQRRRNRNGTSVDSNNCLLM